MFHPNCLNNGFSTGKPSPLLDGASPLLDGGGLHHESHLVDVTPDIFSAGHFVAVGALIGPQGENSREMKPRRGWQLNPETDWAEE